MNSTRFVDITTLFWFVMFITGFMAFDMDVLGMEPVIEIPEHMEVPWDVVNWSVWCIFAADVYYKYRRSENMHAFLRKHWFDIVLLIPFFRVLAILRLLRLVRFVWFAKIGLAIYRGFLKSKRFGGKG